MWVRKSKGRKTRSRCRDQSRLKDRPQEKNIGSSILRWTLLNLTKPVSLTRDKNGAMVKHSPFRILSRPVWPMREVEERRGRYHWMHYDRRSSLFGCDDRTLIVISAVMINSSLHSACFLVPLIDVRARWVKMQFLHSVITNGDLTTRICTVSVYLVDVDTIEKNIWLTTKYVHRLIRNISTFFELCSQYYWTMVVYSTLTRHIIIVKLIWTAKSIVVWFTCSWPSCCIPSHSRPGTLITHCNAPFHPVSPPLSLCPFQLPFSLLRIALSLERRRVKSIDDFRIMFDTREELPIGRVSIRETPAERWESVQSNFFWVWPLYTLSSFVICLNLTVRSL